MARNYFMAAENFCSWLWLNDFMAAASGYWLLATVRGSKEVARAKVRSAWAKFIFRVISVITTAYHINGKIYRASVQKVLRHRTETWALKAEDLHSLERTEGMMDVRNVVEG